MDTQYEGACNIVEQEPISDVAEAGVRDGQGRTDSTLLAGELGVVALDTRKDIVGVQVLLTLADGIIKPANFIKPSLSSQELEMVAASCGLIEACADNSPGRRSCCC